MKGATLHVLGLTNVKYRMMRRNFGVTNNVEFRHGHHPLSRKFTSLDGVVRCKDVMAWFAHKVHMPLEIEVIVGPKDFKQYCL